MHARRSAHVSSLIPPTRLPDACEERFYLTTTRSEFASGCESQSELGFTGSCCLCPDGTDCKEAGATIEELPILEAYWRLSATTAQVVECDHAPACRGSTTSDDDYITFDDAMDELEEVGYFGDDLCNYGYKGPLCG